MQDYLTIALGLSLIFICALVITFNYGKISNSTEKYFIYFIWFTFAVEVLGLILSFNFRLNNIWISNFWICINFLFYLFWFGKILKNKKWNLPMLIVLIISILIAFFVENLQSEFSKIIYLSGTILIIIHCIMYFFESLQSNLQTNLIYQRRFWIVSAQFIFSICMTPLIIFAKELNYGGELYNYILLILNFFLYLFLIIAFSWATKKT